jgi:hypothetical protein
MYGSRDRKRSRAFSWFIFGLEIRRKEHRLLGP